MIDQIYCDIDVKEKLYNFQKDLFQLEQGKYEVLKDPFFIGELIDYYTKLIDQKRYDVAIKIILKLHEIDKAHFSHLSRIVVFVLMKFNEINGMNSNEICYNLNKDVLRGWQIARCH